MKRTGAALTDNEKSMVISVYNYFSGVTFKTEDHQKTTLRKRVAEALGISESTVGVVVADWNERGDNTFTPHKTLGRPKSQPDENLNAHDISFSDELRKPELLELVKINKEKVPFSCVEIAEQYEHEVNFTPPYHCELQPIEGVWSVVKGEVACSGPHPNLLSIRNTLLNAFKEKKLLLGSGKEHLKTLKIILSPMKIYD